MVKPKPEKPTESLLISLPNGLKEEWKEWSKNILQTSISQMIRNAVKEYRKNYDKSEKPSLITEMENEILKLKNERNAEIETYKRIMNEMKEKAEKTEDIREIKDSILSLLELQPMKTKEIAKRIRLDTYETSDILKELHDNKLIKFNEKNWELE